METENNLYLVVGSYTPAEEEGVHLLKFNQEDATYSLISSLKGIVDPSYLVISEKEDLIYAVSEQETDRDAGTVTIKFHRDKEEFELINQQKTSGGAPCYINLLPGRFAVTANYLGGSISVFPLDDHYYLKPYSELYKFQGSGTNPERQEQPHLHCVIFSPDNTYLFATDLGTDHIYRYEISKEENEKFLKEETRKDFSVTPGAGPRHLVFHPNNRFLYLITELSGEIIVFDYNKGDLKEIQQIVSDSMEAAGSADIHVSPDGKFLYSSNRHEADGIAIFSIDPESGLLTHVGYQLTGKHPRNFILTPNGKYLLVASRDDNRIQIFERDLETGKLEATHKEILLSKPVCLKFMKK